MWEEHEIQLTYTDMHIFCTYICVRIRACAHACGVLSLSIANCLAHLLLLIRLLIMIIISVCGGLQRCERDRVFHRELPAVVVGDGLPPLIHFFFFFFG